MNEISQRLYALMEERGTNARRVASDLNLSNSSFTDWKDSKYGPGLKALMKLAPYFKVSLDYLITGKESECASLAEARILRKALRASGFLSGEGVRLYGRSAGNVSG